MTSLTSFRVSRKAQLPIPFLKPRRLVIYRYSYQQVGPITNFSFHVFTHPYISSLLTTLFQLIWFLEFSNFEFSNYLIKIYRDVRPVLDSQTL